MWDKIKSFLKKLSFRDIIIILLAVLCVISFLKMRHYKNIAEEQSREFVDTLSVYKNKLGEEYTARQIHIQTIKEMKKRNDSISAEIKKLQDNPIVVTKVKTIVEIREVPMNSDSIQHEEKDSTYTLVWSSDQKPYFTMKGRTDVKNDFSDFKTTLSYMSMEAMLTVDLVEHGKNGIKVLAKTDNPFIRIGDVQGAFIDPAKSKVIKSYFPKKRWGIGPQLGVGIGNELKCGVWLGLGIQYSLIQF